MTKINKLAYLFLLTLLFTSQVQAEWVDISTKGVTHLPLLSQINGLVNF